MVPVQPRTGKDYVKSVLIGLLTMIVGLLATAVILVTVLAVSQREIPVGPVYLVIPISTFAAGCYWSLRRSSRPKALAQPPSKVAVIAKSTAAGIAVVVSLIVYVTAIWFFFLRKIQGAVGVMVGPYWPVMVAIFVAAFLLEYRRASRRHSLL
jgi:hypothetical protein